MTTIKNIKAREILDSRGNPTIETEIQTEHGFFTAAVPSGASTGKHEALELRDGGERFGGKGVLKAVRNVNELIAPELTGINPEHQQEIDNKMIELDRTKNKEKLGANAILSVSMASAKAAAASKKVPLYEYIAELGNNDKFVMPVPMVLVLEGGKHADDSSDLQELMIMPRSAESFADAIRTASEIYQNIGKNLKKQGFNINVGYEGAYGPSLKSNEKTLSVITEGIEKTGLKPDRDVVIAIDAAASEFYENGKYALESDGNTYDSKGLIEFYSKLKEKYPIFSIEDGLAEDDWDSWTVLTEKLGTKMQIVGDDLTVTNVERLEKAIKQKAINSILIKLNQIGSVTETIAAVNMAKEHGLTAVISHRSAETEDTFIADLVVGLGTGQCKFGATCRSERTAKYNRLLKIEKELGSKTSYHKI